MTMMIFGCAGLDFKGEFEDSFQITVEKEDGNTIDTNCKMGLIVDDGVKNENECIGYFKDGENSYRCSVKVDVEKKKPEKTKLTVKENCEIVLSE